MAQPKKELTDDERRALFLSTLAETAHVGRSAKKAGIPRRTAYNWRAESDDFRDAWDAAAELGTDALEDEATRRAKDGYLKPVYQGGQKVGAVREFSDTLLIFLLKGRRERYRLKDRPPLEELIAALPADVGRQLREALGRHLSGGAAAGGGDPAGPAPSPAV